MLSNGKTILLSGGNAPKLLSAKFNYNSSNDLSEKMYIARSHHFITSLSRLSQRVDWENDNTGIRPVVHHHN